MSDKVGIKETVVVVKEKNGKKEVVGEKKPLMDRLRHIFKSEDEEMAYRASKVGVILVLNHMITGQRKVITGPPNLVTTAGNIYYADRCCETAPVPLFANLYLCTAGPTPVLVTSAYNDFTRHAGDEKAHTATYPLAPDTDADNTGLGETVVSWKFEYTAGDGPFVAIQWAFISVAGAAGGAAILTGYKWVAAWNKDAATSAKIFFNHTLLGA
jgi:hypothetical protein